jgi:hypothetical protein
VIAWSGVSLLAANFNKALCAAKDGGYEWMLMWHGDLFPLGGDWLAGMIAAADERRADVFSAVSPLKGPHGLTSTACDTAEGIRRITMTELGKLPEVFCAADVGERLWPCTRLLINTGMMLVRMARLDPVRCHFTIEDQIALNGAGKHDFRVMPEDWHFSRACNRAGLRVYASKRPAVAHVGQVEYRSDGEPWGVATDTQRTIWEGEQ